MIKTREEEEEEEEEVHLIMTDVLLVAEEDELEAALQEADEAKEIAIKALEREAALKIQIDLKAGKWTVYGLYSYFY